MTYEKKLNNLWKKRANRCRTLNLWWLLLSTWRPWTNSCNGATKLSQSIMTAYAFEVEAVIVANETRRWWCSSLPLSKTCVRNPTCRRHVIVKINGTVTGVWATFSDFWWTVERLQSFLLGIPRESLWSARQHPTWNNWLAVWFGFEEQICCSWLGHILSEPLARLPQLDSPCCNTVIHVWNHTSLWACFLCNEH